MRVNFYVTKENINEAWSRKYALRRVLGKKIKPKYSVIITVCGNLLCDHEDEAYIINVPKPIKVWMNYTQEDLYVKKETKGYRNLIFIPDFLLRKIK